MDWRPGGPGPTIRYGTGAAIGCCTLRRPPPPCQVFSTRGATASTSSVRARVESRERRRATGAVDLHAEQRESQPCGHERAGEQLPHPPSPPEEPTRERDRRRVVPRAEDPVQRRRVLGQLRCAGLEEAVRAGVTLRRRRAYERRDSSLPRRTCLTSRNPPWQDSTVRTSDAARRGTHGEARPRPRGEGARRRPGFPCPGEPSVAFHLFRRRWSKTVRAVARGRSNACWQPSRRVSASRPLGGGHRLRRSPPAWPG
jgi:hypothetical protein